MPKYTPTHPIRIVTAASLFDGHDASINVMRRILQAQGAEVIHLGHNRAARDVVETAIQEDAQGIAVSSYQGGHVEYFGYLRDLLDEAGATHVKLFGGGGGVIVQDEIDGLAERGVRIFSPDDGMRMGLEGMISEIIQACDFDPAALQVEDGADDGVAVATQRDVKLARSLTRVEQTATQHSGDGAPQISVGGSGDSELAPVVGITGTGGAGKSTLTDELIRRFLMDFDDLDIAVVSVDPTRQRTGGALLGDRIRMNASYGAYAGRVFMRSLATRQAHRSVSQALREVVQTCRASGFGLVLVETAGIGQSDTEIASLADLTLYVMTPEFGAPTQLEKIGMLDTADLVALNKMEKRGSEDALRGVQKQMQRNRATFDQSPDQMPVYATQASRFNDPGVTRLYRGLVDQLGARTNWTRTATLEPGPAKAAATVVPPNRVRYLSDIAETGRSYRAWATKQADIAQKWGQAKGALGQLPADASDDVRQTLSQLAEHRWNELDSESTSILDGWDALSEQYSGDVFEYQVRGRTLSVPLTRTTLAGSKVPRVALPRTTDPGERLRFALLENVPGGFPYTAGVFPFKREGEDPTRMFAGEGAPERTNRRFHLVSLGQPAARLSTAFDSVTLYGADPAVEPDVYGKIGNAGVSICTLDDMKKLYSGFDLCAPTTSVSMTINGPAPMLLAFFFNTAVDQQVERHLVAEGSWEAAQTALDKHAPDRPTYNPWGPTGLMSGLPQGHDGSGLGLLGATGQDLVDWGVMEQSEFDTIRDRTLTQVRGTVQADILKEDQAQNTCIFSTEFALRLMGDVQQAFIDRGVRNYYSVSVSGYHIAEAGANPITQLAFTLANGFTYVEYYLSRGMSVDDFARNLSFFFSNGMDAEYTVIGRVARRIWSIAMRERYSADDRSQKLKYHIQTSGRSLHAQEISFNDIRTTLQALLAIYDNCNSLHTNAYDEAITTPTEQSVRSAMAIQMIINRELGLAMNENPLQGAYIVDYLTDLVEEAVWTEFDRLTDRGGVLGAMETMYQRGRIQEESMLYEQRKHSGELPIIGVNTFRADGENEPQRVELMRSSDDEKQAQLASLNAFHARHASQSADALTQLKQVALAGGNVFDQLLDTVRVCSLGQITDALYQVGGQYRRSM